MFEEKSTCLSFTLIIDLFIYNWFSADSLSQVIVSTGLDLSGNITADTTSDSPNCSQVHYNMGLDPLCSPELTLHLEPTLCCQV